MLFTTTLALATWGGIAHAAEKKETKCLERCDKIGDGDMKAACRTVASKPKAAGGCMEGRDTQSGCCSNVVQSLTKWHDKACGGFEGDLKASCEKSAGDCRTSYIADPNAVDVRKCIKKAAKASDPCLTVAFKDAGNAIKDRIKSACWAEGLKTFDWNADDAASAWEEKRNQVPAIEKDLAAYNAKWGSCDKHRDHEVKKWTTKNTRPKVISWRNTRPKVINWKKHPIEGHQLEKTPDRRSSAGKNTRPRKNTRPKVISWKKHPTEGHQLEKTPDRRSSAGKNTRPKVISWKKHPTEGHQLDEGDRKNEELPSEGH
jgi:hypothetical protein